MNNSSIKQETTDITSQFPYRNEDSCVQQHYNCNDIINEATEAVETAGNNTTSFEFVTDIIASTSYNTIIANIKNEHIPDESADYPDPLTLCIPEYTHLNEIPNDNQMHQCDICLKYFSNSDELSVHRYSHTSDTDIYTCLICYRTYLTRRQVYKHVRQCDKKLTFNCDICSKSFRDIYALLKHRYSHTSNSDIYTCLICYKIYENKRQLYKHIVTTHTTKIFECEFCHKRCGSYSTLAYHRRIHKKQRYKCDICHKRYTQEEHLIVHMHTHTGDKPYECDICHKQMSQRSSLTVHRRTHTGERRHQCNVCNKRYYRKGDLNMHFLIHTGEKPHECEVCHKRFTLKHNLTVHMRTHTGEKPYECNICHKRFKHSSHVTIHKRTHTGATEFECDICHQQYTNRQNLVLHKRRHTGDMYSCNVCHKQFTANRLLIAHMRLHTGEKPFECNMCDKRYSLQSSARTHFIRAHKGTY